MFEICCPVLLTASQCV